MRVSLINPSLVSEDAIGTCVINQARFFRERGDEVRVYLPVPPQNVPSDIEALTRVVTLSELVQEKREHFSLSDLYIYHYPARYPLIETIRGLDRGTVIFYYHNVTPPELWGTDVGRERLVEGIDGTALAHYADYCIVDSPFNKQDLVDRLGYAPERIFVLPLAVDLAEFTPGEPDRELLRRHKLAGHQILLFVGRMAGNKRVDLLIKALARVQVEMPHTKLLLVGDDRTDPAFRPIVSAAQARAVDLGIAGDVIWTGRVEDVAPYFRLADVYVTASLHEGFGVPLIEAMASGVPVVASRAGAMPWVLGDAGLFCEPQDANDLAEKTLAVLRDAGLRQTAIERGLERARAFSLENYEAGLASILEESKAHEVPSIPSRPSRAAQSREGKLASGVWSSLLLETLADAINAHSDVAMRDYEVRSGIPLLGPLIVWLRRNLTSHLWEPYLDPIIERQVTFNRRVAEWIGRLSTSWTAIDQRQTDLEDRVRALEAQVESLQRRLTEDLSEDA
jgi:glycosyltransferase involved in cell wall biosynthesis